MDKKSIRILLARNQMLAMSVRRSAPSLKALVCRSLAMGQIAVLAVILSVASKSTAMSTEARSIGAPVAGPGDNPVFTRFGSKQCGDSAVMIYSGAAAAKYRSHAGKFSLRERVDTTIESWARNYG